MWFEFVSRNKTKYSTKASKERELKTEEIKHDKGKMRKGNIRNQCPTNENIVKELSTEHTHTHGIDCKPINKRKKKQFMLAKKRLNV